jgi:hypothetical protein
MRSPARSASATRFSWRRARHGNEGQSVNLDIRLRQGTYTIGTTGYDFG